MKNQPESHYGIIAIILLFLVSLFAFFMLNLYTNISTDDFGFKFIKSLDVERTYCRVKTVNEVIESQATHYYNMNGRVLANGLAQLFLISDNKVWFDLANTLMFGLLQILIVLVAGFRYKEISILQYLFVIISLWFLIPGPNQTFLWLDGSFNYLWVAVLVLAFIYIHERIVSLDKKVSWHWHPLLFISGFIAGAGHEVISLGVAGAYCLYYLFNRRKITGPVIAMISGFCMGTAFVVFAPGNMVRMESEGVRESTLVLMIAQRLWAFLLSAKSMIALIILSIVLVYFRVSQKNTLSRVLKGNTILLISMPISLLFIFFAGAFEERVFFGVALFSIIVLLSIVRQHKDILYLKPAKILVGLLVMAMTIEFFSVSKVLRENKTNFDNDEIIWLSSEDNVFEFRQKRTNRFVSLGLGEHDRYFWQNIVMSKYYGREYMIFLPKELYSGMYLSRNIIDNQNIVMRCCSVTDTFDYTFYRFTDSRFLVMPIGDYLTDKIGKGAYIRFTPFAPIEVKKLDLRQKVTKLIYGKNPEPISEEKIFCFGIKTKQGSYLYFKAPEHIPLQTINSAQLFVNEDESDYELQLQCVSEIR